ncbi:probable cytochrome P450 49a1 [Homarus americanus]|nr:probable cytochrome P450 49a1 [Homarus americanus]
MTMILGAITECAVFGAHATKCAKYGSSLLLPRCIATGAVQQQINAAKKAQPNDERAAPRPTSEIPGPRIFPIIGSLLSMLINYKFDSRAIHKMWIEIIKDYGPIVQFHQPGMGKMVALTNPDDIELVTRATIENPVRIGFESLQKIRMDTVDDYFEKKTGILIENGEEWWRVRSRVQTPMMKIKNVNAYLTRMDEVTLVFMDRIAALQEQFGEMPSDFQFELYKWALESVSLIALNRRLGCLDPDIPMDSKPMKMIKIVNELFDLLNETEINLPYWKIYPTRAFRKLKKNHQEFLELADYHIQETEAQLNSNDSSGHKEPSMMETLLLTPGLSRKDVVTLILDMLFAGIDTTSHTIGFTLYLLARNPEVQARLQREVDSVLGDLEGPITPNHMAQLSYLKAVIKESLRIFPLTPGFVRTLEKDIVLGGYCVPKGWMAVGFNIFIGWDEAYFPRAKEFIPERWLRHRPLGPIHPYASLPFGSGTRMCVGRRIAEQELHTFMARVMHRFTVDYKHEDIDCVSKLVFVPSKPLKFTFTERR